MGKNRWVLVERSWGGGDINHNTYMCSDCEKLLPEIFRDHVRSFDYCPYCGNMKIKVVKIKRRKV